MNIFVLDEDPIIAAQYHCDKHVVKMILETAQMLSTAVRMGGFEIGYKATHVNHPCNVWIRESEANFKWALTLLNALLDEYELRYNKVHAVRFDNMPEIFAAFMPSFQQKELTPFAQAMPDLYKNPDPVTAYRNYYKGEKMGFAKWKCGAPRWI